MSLGYDGVLGKASVDVDSNRGEVFTKMLLAVTTK